MADTIPTRTITLEGARRLVDAAIAKAVELGTSMCFTVADPSGEPVMSVRMDEAPRLSAEIARNKAYTVAAFKGMPTDRWWGAIEGDPALIHGITHTPRITIFGGGVPLIAEGALVGAFGASGGSAEQDRAVAEFAASLLKE